MNAEALFALCCALATALGAEWHAHTDEQNARNVYLTRRPDGLRLWCRLAEGRLRISPDHLSMVTVGGRTTTYHYDQPSITVDPQRPAERIAADIRRRLLADAAAWWVTATAAVERSRRQWETVQRQRDELLALPGAFPGHDVTTVCGPGWRCELSGTGRTDLRIDSVEFSVAVAALDAYLLARLVAERAPAAE